MGIKRKSPKLKDVETNLLKAHRAFATAVQSAPESHLELAGTIKHFEMLYELLWKALGRLCSEMGKEAYGPKEIFSAAFELGLLADSPHWQRMIEDRNLTVHTYDLVFAKEMVQRIRQLYAPLFLASIDTFRKAIRR